MRAGGARRRHSVRLDGPRRPAWPSRRRWSIATQGGPRRHRVHWRSHPGTPPPPASPCAPRAPAASCPTARRATPGSASTSPSLDRTRARRTSERVASCQVEDSRGISASTRGDDLGRETHATWSLGGFGISSSCANGSARQRFCTMARRSPRGTAPQRRLSCLRPMPLRLRTSSYRYVGPDRLDVTRVGCDPRPPSGPPTLQAPRSLRPRASPSRRGSTSTSCPPLSGAPLPYPAPRLAPSSRCSLPDLLGKTEEAYARAVPRGDAGELPAGAVRRGTTCLSAREATLVCVCPRREARSGAAPHLPPTSTRPDARGLRRRGRGGAAGGGTGREAPAPAERVGRGEREPAAAGEFAPGGPGSPRRDPGRRGADGRSAAHGHGGGPRRRPKGSTAPAGRAATRGGARRGGLPPLVRRLGAWGTAPPQRLGGHDSGGCWRGHRRGPGGTRRASRHGPAGWRRGGKSARQLRAGCVRVPPRPTSRSRRPAAVVRFAARAPRPRAPPTPPSTAARASRRV